MRHLAIVAVLAVTGSIAHASPVRHRHRHHKHYTPPRDPDVVAITDDPDEPVDVPVTVHEHAPPRPHDWHVAIGPNVWASSVDANVSVGGKSVSTGIDFFQLEHHARYGVPLLAEVRYGRFSLVGDVTYGVIDVDGAHDVGPLMVTVAGSASSLMADGIAGVRVVGDEHSPFALEARGGLRYQRTAIAASLGVDGASATQIATVDTGADALAGTRVFVRPSPKLYFTGAADVGVFGTSSKTWSASADASVMIGARALISAGYRTLTTYHGLVDLVMHGPRVAVQVVF